MLADRECKFLPTKKHFLVTKPHSQASEKVVVRWLCPIMCRAGSILFWRIDKFFINIGIGLQYSFYKRLERNEIATT